MTDEELIEALRSIDHMNVDDCFLQSHFYSKAADRIQELANTHWQVEAMQQNALLHDALTRAEAAEAKLAKAVEALRLVTDACDQGKMVSLGAGGMSIYAQIRNSAYQGVPAWPIEEARAVLAELEKTE